MEQCVAAILKNDFDSYAINYVKTDAPQAVIAAVLAAREDAICLPPLATSELIVRHMYGVCCGNVRSTGPVLVELTENISHSHPHWKP